MVELRKRFIVSLATVVVTLATTVFFVNTSQAATVSPPRLELSGDPGENLNAEIKIYNEKTSSQTFYIFTRDFEAKDETGNPQFVISRDGFGTWIKPPSQITVGPKQESTIAFQVLIPQGAEPGGYFAALFASPELPDTGDQAQIALRSQIGSLIFLRINGEIPQSTSILEFRTLGHARFFVRLPIGFFYRFQNSGNDRVLPIGDIIIKNTFGRTTKIIKANPTQGNVLPKSIRRFESVWDASSSDANQDPLVLALSTPGNGFWNAVKYEWKNFALGYYRAHLNLAYGNVSTETATAKYTFFVFPWQLILVILVIVVILFFIIRFFIRRYNRRIIQQSRRRKKK